MKKLSFLLILSSLLFTPTVVFSTIVYDNTQDYKGYLSTINLVGDEVTLESTERLVTEFSFGYWNLNTDGSQNVHVWFYENDGGGGAPGTLLLNGDLGSHVLQRGLDKKDLVISGLSILVPDTFTWVVQWEGIGDEGMSEAYPLLLFYDPPTTGSSGDYYWQKVSGTWVKFTDISNSCEFQLNFKAQIKAESVPEPNTIFLLGSGLIGLWGLRKKFKN